MNPGTVQEIKESRTMSEAGAGAGSGSGSGSRSSLGSASAAASSLISPSSFPTHPERLVRICEAVCDDMMACALTGKWMDGPPTATADSLCSFTPLADLRESGVRQLLGVYDSILGNPSGGSIMEDGGYDIEGLAVDIGIGLFRTLVPLAEHFVLSDDLCVALGGEIEKWWERAREVFVHELTQHTMLDEEVELS